jgi:PHD/YefM family antitoxin component YafN of YafNO toxin-antitoxin module
MEVLDYRNYTEARKELRELLDAAESGRPVGVQRRSRRVAIVEADAFLAALENSRSIPNPVAVAEESGWTLLLPGLPIAVDAAEFDDAVDEFVLALREYAEDWIDRLHAVPNHAGNWALIQVAALSTDDQLKRWVTGAPE